MPKKPPIHTVPDPDGGWSNKRGGKEISHHRKQEAAAEAGRRQARRDETEHRLHGRDGQIRETRSYGNDPIPPRDRD
jgi:hypothetical protein